MAEREFTLCLSFYHSLFRYLRAYTLLYYKSKNTYNSRESEIARSFLALKLLKGTDDSESRPRIRAEAGKT